VGQVIGQLSDGRHLGAATLRAEVHVSGHSPIPIFVWNQKIVVVGLG
jgi:hypothetical protein